MVAARSFGAPDAPIEQLRAALEAGDLPKAVRAGEAAVDGDPASSEAQDLQE